MVSFINCIFNSAQIEAPFPDSSYLIGDSWHIFVVTGILGEDRSDKC